MNNTLTELSREQLNDLKRGISDRERELEHAKWDAELVGRCFRISYDKTNPFQDRSYITLQESMACGSGAERYVFADAQYVYIRHREGDQLTYSGFKVSGLSRKEPYLQIQPIFFSWSDFRSHLNSWSHDEAGPKLAEEVSIEEYRTELGRSIAEFERMAQ